MKTEITSKRFLPLASIIVILLTSLNLISSNARKHPMDVKVSLNDIRKHGLSLVGPTDPSFNEGLVEALGDSSGGISDTARLLSVFVTNSNQRSVVAYHLKWELADANGKTVSHERSYADSSLLMENRGTKGKHTTDLGGNSIASKSSRFISLVPLLTDIRAGHGDIGGAFFQRSDANQIDSVTRALQDRNTKEIATRFTERLDQIVSVSVSLDGAFFDDGSFVGPDESGFFSKFKAQLEARHDLYTSILNKIRVKKSRQAILDYVTKSAQVPRAHLGSGSSPSEFYDFYRRFYAEEISRVWNVSGDEAALRFVEARLSKPWMPVQKLE